MWFWRQIKLERQRPGYDLQISSEPRQHMPLLLEIVKIPWQLVRIVSFRYEAVQYLAILFLIKVKIRKGCQIRVHSRRLFNTTENVTGICGLCTR